MILIADNTNADINVSARTLICQRGQIIWQMTNQNRDDWIRTSDPFVPNEVRYQAALHPDTAIPNYENSITNIYKSPKTF